jgi:hypothetical protein
MKNKVDAIANEQFVIRDGREQRQSKAKKPKNSKTGQKP